MLFEYDRGAEHARKGYCGADNHEKIILDEFSCVQVRVLSEII
jgi:hypothetical protein